MNFVFRGRRSIRLKGWDYSLPGWYFITLCTQNRECLFGSIMDGTMNLTDSGNLVKKSWLEIDEKYPNVMLDEFIVMPNHIHGIIGMHVGAGPRACPNKFLRTRSNENGRTYESAPTKKCLSLPDIIRQFKTFTTKKYIESIINCNWPPFQRRLWQRNYFEHIIRHEKELNQIRQYIEGNPAAWTVDDENPAKKDCPGVEQRVGTNCTYP